MNTRDFSLNLKSVGEDGTFEGFASVFGAVDQIGDVTEPGAFIESVARAKSDGRFIPMLWQHAQSEPIGVWDEISENAKGLFVKGRLILENDPVAQRAYGKLKAKALGGLSIGYRIPAGGAEPDKTRPGVTRLKKIDLREISLVTMPVLTQAKVTSVKAAENLREAFGRGETPALKSIEEYLCDGGFPNALATAFVSLGKAAFRRSDSGDEAEKTAAFLSALRAGVSG